MAMARRDSVTVSMAADTSGTLIFSLRVKWVCVFTSAGRTELFPGTSSTSSKVSPSRIAPSIIPAFRTVRVLKQRSPAGGRWAARRIHQIEKMSHREFSILRAREKIGQAWPVDGPLPRGDYLYGMRLGENRYILPGPRDKRR